MITPVTNLHLHMSDSEIITSYRQAKDQLGQIKVLAELNAVSEWDMRDYLVSLGIDVTKAAWIKGSYSKHIHHEHKEVNDKDAKK